VFSEKQLCYSLQSQKVWNDLGKASFLCKSYFYVAEPFQFAGTWGNSLGHVYSVTYHNFLCIRWPPNKIVCHNCRCSFDDANIMPLVATHLVAMNTVCLWLTRLHETKIRRHYQDRFWCKCWVRWEVYWEPRPTLLVNGTSNNTWAWKLN
jgi:hypothetical protein